MRRSTAPSPCGTRDQVLVGVGGVGDLHRVAVEEHLPARPQRDGAQVDRVGDRRGVEEAARRGLAALGPPRASVPWRCGRAPSAFCGARRSGSHLPWANSCGFCPWNPAMIAPWSPTNRMPSRDHLDVVRPRPPRAGAASCRRRTRTGPAPARRPRAANLKRIVQPVGIGEIVVDRAADVVGDRAGVGGPGLGAERARPGPAPRTPARGCRCPCRPSSRRRNRTSRERPCACSADGRGDPAAGPSHRSQSSPLGTGGRVRGDLGVLGPDRPVRPVVHFPQRADRALLDAPADQPVAGPAAVGQQVRGHLRLAGRLDGQPALVPAGWRSACAS